MVSAPPKDRGSGVDRLPHGVNDIRCHSIDWSSIMSDRLQQGCHLEQKIEEKMIKHGTVVVRVCNDRIENVQAIQSVDELPKIVACYTKR